MQENQRVLGLDTIRRNRGISLEQISNSTKISVRSLEAIENGDFQKLPGGIYNTSYIRQYARAIDYDESEILSAYQQFMVKADVLPPSQNGGEKGVFGRGFSVASLLGH
jgi:cytoskeletal protein RodZ